MGAAYTPGLTVSAATVVRKTRRLPLQGSVLVTTGAPVTPDTIVARAEIPGILQTLKVGTALGIDPADLPGMLLVAPGDEVQRGQVVARTKGLWGWFKQEYLSPTSGTVEIISPVSGNVSVRGSSTPVEVTAYVHGEVIEVLPNEGVVLEARGALIQGIFGVGGERRAPLRMVSQSPEAPLTETDITPDCAGHLIVGGANVSQAALQRAAEVGVAGVVVGGIIDQDLVGYLGHDIGVAITGHEDIPLTLILTEGFGEIAMAERTFALLRTLEGREASFSGATQIRAGVIRPEIIVASEARAVSGPDTGEVALALTPGARIRIIREPNFGRLATVITLLPLPQQIASGAVTRVLEAQLIDNGETVIVPRANVELLL